MKRLMAGLAAVAVTVIVSVGYHAWWQANRDAQHMIDTAAALIRDGQGPDRLGTGRLQTFLAVKDPSFLDHNGVDLLHPRPFRRTLTQALAHDNLSWRAPGLGGLQEVFYAVALDQRLPKSAQLALYLSRLPMGTDAVGEAVTGFFSASMLIFDRAPDELDEAEFLTLLSATLDPLPLQDARAENLPEELLQRRQQLMAFLQGECPLSRPSQGLPESCI